MRGVRRDRFDLDAHDRRTGQVVILLRATSSAQAATVEHA